MASDSRVRFVDQLKELRTLAGEPSLADLEKQNLAWLKQQTISDLLAGKGVRLPRWERIAAFVTACVRIGVVKIAGHSHLHEMASDGQKPGSPRPAVEFLQAEMLVWRCAPLRGNMSL